jgi:predicted DNA-binding transcriptional regulator AlpA
MIIREGHEAPEALFTEKQVSSWLGISTPSLQRMRSNGTGPEFVQLSARRIGYRQSAIEAWLSVRTINRVGECAAPFFEPKPALDLEKKSAAKNGDVA